MARPLFRLGGRTGLALGRGLGSAPVSPVPIPHIANNYLAGYAQVDWRIRPNLTLNLGLRWESASCFGRNSI